MATTKLLLLVVGAVAQLYGSTPPNVRPPIEQLREQRGAELIVPRILVFSKIILWSWAFLEASVIIALSEHCPPALAHSLLYLLPNSLVSSDPTALTTPTPTFFTGTALILAGTLLRVHCFHALGHHFTFELAIRPTHELVTQGVYGVIRHPSYTGLLAMAIGGFACVLDPKGTVVAVSAGAFGLWAGSNEHGDGHVKLTTMLACVWAMGLGVLSVGVSQRMNREDAMLEKNFGDKWRVWAKRVPYRLVPGVY